MQRKLVCVLFVMCFVLLSPDLFFMTAIKLWIWIIKARLVKFFPQSKLLWRGVSAARRLLQSQVGSLQSFVSCNVSAVSCQFHLSRSLSDVVSYQYQHAPPCPRVSCVQSHLPSPSLHSALPFTPSPSRHVFARSFSLFPRHNSCHDTQLSPVFIIN